MLSTLLAARDIYLKEEVRVIKDIGGISLNTGLQDRVLMRGDLWTLVWDGRLEGHILVAAIKDGYILGWPATMPGEPSFSPGMLFQDTGGDTVTVWPTRETGLGLHLLGQPLGPLMDRSTIQSIAARLDDGEVPDGVFAPPTDVAVTSNDDWSMHMTNHWSALCFHTGRTFEEEPYLDPAKVSEVGGNAREIGRILNLTPPQTRTLWDGDANLRTEDLETLAQHYNVDGQYLIRSDPTQSWWDRLASPVYKEAVENACRQRRASEGDIRAEVARSAYALAARQDSDRLADQKLRDALHRVASARPES